MAVAAGTICLLLVSGRGGWAEDGAGPSELLKLDGPVVEATVLDRENLAGLGLPAAGLAGQPMEFGVILWDEVKPGQPSPPPSSHNSLGQSSTTFKATSN